MHRFTWIVLKCNGCEAKERFRVIGSTFLIKRLYFQHPLCVRGTRRANIVLSLMKTERDENALRLLVSWKD